MLMKGAPPSTRRMVRVRREPGPLRAYDAEHPHVEPESCKWVYGGQRRPNWVTQGCPSTRKRRISGLPEDHPVLVAIAAGTYTGPDPNREPRLCPVCAGEGRRSWNDAPYGLCGAMGRV